MSERSNRRYRRLTLRIDVEYESERGIRRDIATTLGAGGLFIACDDPLDEGSGLKARFRLPGGETLHEIAGRVVWTHREEDGASQTPGMGVAFADPANGAVLASELEALLAAREIRRSPRGAS